MSCVVGDVAVDGGGAAAEGHGAVVGEGGGAEGAVAGNLAIVEDAASGIIECAAGEIDQAGVGSHAVSDEDFVAGGGGVVPFVGDVSRISVPPRAQWFPGCSHRWQ